MIPEGIKVKIGLGEVVEAGRELLEVDESGEKIINVSDKLVGLSAAEKVKLSEKLTGVEINAGEVIYKSKRVFPKKYTLPINGMVLKLDEFGNLHYKESGDKTKKLKCPIRSKVVKNDGKSLELEFQAIEYIGVGVVEGKAWATAGVGYSTDINDLSVKDADKILLTNKLDKNWMVKAEVVGIKGVVIVAGDDGEKDDRIDFRLPVLALEEKEWRELKDNGGSGKRAMINATDGRLLLEI